MLFTSLDFIFVFLPLCLAAVFGLAHFNRTAGTLCLIAASLIFYSRSGFVLLLAGSILLNFGFGRWIVSASRRARLQNAIALGAVGLNLLALGFYKYLVPALVDADALPAILAAVVPPGILPLGISFFTITQIMYLLDCREESRTGGGLVDYAAFVAFFPTVISGPILRHREMQPQVEAAEALRLRGDNLSAGITLFILGLGKKALLADAIAPYADAGFRHVDQVQLIGAWGAVLAYALQLYFDFSGYSDMAIGLGRMLGIRVPLNFASPYKAASIIDYWQRWHMSLTRFFTTYLYNPLALRIVRARAKRGRLPSRRSRRTIGEFLTTNGLPTIVTMTLIGIWHGSGLQFLCFGLLHGSFLVINHAWRSFGPQPMRVEGSRVSSALRHAVGTILTFGAVLIAFAFFRTPSVGAALDMLAGMVGGHGIGWPTTANTAQAALTGGLLLIVWAMPNTQQIMTEPPALWRFLAWRPNLAWAIVAGLIFVFAIEGIDASRSFLYFQF